jgi:hypothetical protein
MFEIVTTNGAAIATITVLWSTLTWAVTYMYMTEKIRRKDEVIQFLDIYIEEVEQHYGHVIDDYIDHYYSDGEWVKA